MCLTVRPQTPHRAPIDASNSFLCSRRHTHTQSIMWHRKRRLFGNSNGESRSATSFFFCTPFFFPRVKIPRTSFTASDSKHTIYSHVGGH